MLCIPLTSAPVEAGGEEGVGRVQPAGGRLSLLSSGAQTPVRQLRYGDPRPLPAEGKKQNGFSFHVFGVITSLFPILHTLFYIS